MYVRNALQFFGFGAEATLTAARDVRSIVFQDGFGLFAGQLAQLLGNSLLTVFDDTADTGICDSKGVYKPLPA